MEKNLQVLSDFNVFDKYAKHIGDRRETWEEIIARNVLMHIERFPEEEDQIYKAYGKVLNKEVVPSMRSLQFSGKAIKLNPARLYNCSALAMNHFRAFSETMFLLLGGSGVGFSVQKRHIEKLPWVKPPIGEIRYVVSDDIVGWSNAIKFLMKAYFFGRPRPIFDLSDIRPKGTPLKTAGGNAPGPEPLAICLENIEGVLKNYKYGEQLSSIDIFDIQCYIAEAVLAGGSRRSAMICLFDKDDENMAKAKTGNWWEHNAQRAMANISAILNRHDTKEGEFTKLFNHMLRSNSGEPGFVFTSDNDMLLNPCAEISIPDMGFCNLTEVNISKVKTNEDLYKAVEVATYIGTLQASYTDFFFLRKEWKENAERDALLGVSLTGIASKSKEELEALDFKGAAELAVKVNREVSTRLGINPAKRITTIKPSGTTSTVLGCSSGIHPWYDKYYLRSMRLNKKDAVYQYLKTVCPPEILEDDQRDPERTGILRIPIKAPLKGQFRTESAKDFLERVKFFHKNWIYPGHIEGVNKHNVSCTINYRPEEEEEVRAWLWENRYVYTGVSLLPYDNGSYVQAPFETISKERFDYLVPILPDIDLTKVVETEDFTDLKGEIACGGSGCEI